ncbi:MAG: enoyl-CoA hydratase/isomerase family protein [Acidisphaera sp.]|nr:enoyl-CoA hydratase/isomerase family protein [Acidisphaera sp.]
MDLTQCRLEVVDFIATVTMDRPPVNAQNAGIREEMTRVFDALSDRDDVRAVILTGAGKFFSAGADIKERPSVGREPGDYIRHNRLTREFFYSIMECSKPVIAAVNGAAIGAGLATVLMCDIMLIAEDAYVSMPEIDVGLSGGNKMLMRFFSIPKAKMMFFTGERVPAAELFRLGLVEAVLPPAELMPRAREIAGRIAEKSPLAIKHAKRNFNTVETLSQRDGYRFEQDVTHELSKTDYAKEAQRAFIEKRKPVFR